MLLAPSSSCFNSFVFIAPATTEIYTLSLHDALPIWLHQLALASRQCADQGEPWRPREPARASEDGASRDHRDRKSTRLNSSHTVISYAVFCLKKKKNIGVRGDAA